MITPELKDAPVIKKDEKVLGVSKTLMQSLAFLFNHKQKLKVVEPKK